MGLAVTVLALFGQGRPATVKAEESPFRVSVVPDTTPGCGAAVSGAGLRQDAEARLRSAGMTVSNVHNSELSLDVDCVPVAGAKSRGSLAVRQCMGFSEVVSAAAGDSQMLASTWHKCESYICDSGYCRDLIAANQMALLDAFFANLAERRAQSRPAANPPAYQADITGLYARVIFFGLYTIACMTMGIYWQLRKRAEARVG